LKEVLAGGGTKAGEYRLFDPVAIRVVERSKIPTVIFDGREPENLTKVFSDSTIGTVIVHEE
jgi:uridylate kinase